ncbi:DUF3572 family protein [Phreatobacter sp.]|uniref:DUF3572 family protein n=1 Tax=Phreatobacter sp. TaxID=1966341 RepID=UPI003F6F4665
MTQREAERRRNGAEATAVAALAFLAAEPDRLSRFLALAGLGGADVRAAAGEPGFLAAVMEHLMSEEDLLLAFAADQGIRPEAVVRAAHALGAGPWERDHA